MSGLKSMFIPAQVLRERLKENASEISIFQGEILLIHPALHCHTAGKSWVLASNNRGRAGLVPETHVKKIKSTAFFASESYPQAKTPKTLCHLTSATRSANGCRPLLLLYLMNPQMNHSCGSRATQMPPLLYPVCNWYLICVQCCTVATAVRRSKEFVIGFSLPAMTWR